MAIIPKFLHFRSAPLADFFGYFLVRRQESNITAPNRLVERYALFGYRRIHHCTVCAEGVAGGRQQVVGLGDPVGGVPENFAGGTGVVVAAVDTIRPA